MGFKDSVVNLVIKGKDLLSPATESAQAGMGKLQERSASLNDELKKLTNLERNITEFKRLTAETERLENNWKDVEFRADYLSEAFKSVSKPTREMARDLDKAQKSADGAKVAFLRNREALDRLSPRLKAAGVNMKNLDSAQDGLEQSSRRLRSDIASVNSSLSKQKKAAKGAGDALNRADKQGAGFGHSIRNAGAGIVAFVAAGLGLDRIARSIVSIFKTGDDFEKLDSRLTGVFGSIEKGEKASRWIQEFTSKTPLQLEQVSQGFLTLKNYGLDPTNGSMRALVDQNELMGGSFSDLEGLLSAVGQAWSKQKLQQEEILQLVERGVPAWELLARSTGKSVPELAKLSSQGKLGRDVISGLIQEIGKTGNGAAAASMRRASGLVSNLKDEWSQFYRLIAESGSLDYLKGELQTLIVTIKQLKSDGTLDRWAKNISDGIVSVGESIKSSISFVALYKDELLLLGKAFVAIKVVGAIRGLLQWTTALKASRAELRLSTLQAAGARKGFAGLGRTLFALARPIPITLAIIGVGLVTKGIDNVVERMSGLADIQRANALFAKEQEIGRLREANALYVQATALEHYSNIALKTGDEVAKLNDRQRQSYADQLGNAKQYYDVVSHAMEEQGKAGVDVAQKLESLRLAQDRVVESLRQVTEESIRASEAMRLGISKEALDALTAFSNLKAKGEETPKAISDAFKALKIKTPEGIAAMAQAMAKLVNTSQVSGNEIKEALEAPLKKLDSSGLKAFQREFSKLADDAGRSGQVMEAVLAQAFLTLGADLELAKSGITDVGRNAIDAFSVVAENVELTGRTAQESAKIINNAFSAALSNISTNKGITELQAQLDSLREKGLVAGESYQELTTKLVARQKELADSVKDVKDAAEGATAKLIGMGNQSKEAAEKASRGMEGARAIAADLGAFYDGITARLASMSRAAVDAFKSLQGATQKPLSDIDRMQQRIDSLGRSMTDLRSAGASAWDFTGISTWMRETAANSQQVERDFLKQKIAVEELLKSYERGATRSATFRRSVESLSSQFDLLDDQDLSGLRSAVLRVQGEVDGLGDSLSDTVSSLQQELAGLRGDTEEVEKLRFYERQLELQEQLKKAKKLGDKASISSARAALKLNAEVYAAKREQMAEQTQAEEEERARRVVEEEERRQNEEREQRDALDVERARGAVEDEERRQRARDRAAVEDEERRQRARDRSAVEDEEQRSNEVSSNKPTIIVRLESGGNSVDVATSSSKELLDVLQSAGMRST